MERRRHPRHTRYFAVRYGTHEAEYDARTRDISAGGLFLATRDVLPMGTRLWLEVFIEPERTLRLEGVVVRHLDGLPARRREGGVAVRLLGPAEALAPYIAAPRGRPEDAPPVAFASREALDRAVRNGLGDGQLFVWLNQTRAVGEQLQLALKFDFAAQALEVRGTITQVVEDAGRTGVALALEDLDGVRARLAQLLEEKR
mgnify:CR=1 FL=1